MSFRSDSYLLFKINHWKVSQVSLYIARKQECEDYSRKFDLNLTSATDLATDYY